MRIKSIKNFEEYKISDTGIVFSTTGKPLSLHLTYKGYHVVKLFKNREPKNIYVHKLVLETFVSEKPEGKQCNHKNGTKTDNKHTNLEWVTSEENRIHALKMGMIPSGFAKLKEDEVWLIKKILYCDVVSQAFIGKMFKVSQTLISDISLNRIWKRVSCPTKSLT